MSPRPADGSGVVVQNIIPISLEMETKSTREMLPDIFTGYEDPRQRELNLSKMYTKFISEVNVKPPINVPIEKVKHQSSSSYASLNNLRKFPNPKKTNCQFLKPLKIIRKTMQKKCLKPVQMNKQRKLTRAVSPDIVTGYDDPQERLINFSKMSAKFLAVNVEPFEIEEQQEEKSSHQVSLDVQSGVQGQRVRKINCRFLKPISGTRNVLISSKSPKPVEGMEEKTFDPSVNRDRYLLPLSTEKPAINLRFLEPLNTKGGGIKPLISTGEKLECHGKQTDPVEKEDISSTAMSSQVEMEIDDESYICLGEFPATGLSNTPQPDANSGGNAIIPGPDPTSSKSGSNPTHSTNGTGPASDPTSSMIGNGPEPDQTSFMIRTGPERDHTSSMIGTDPEPDPTSFMIGTGHEPDPTSFMIGTGPERDHTSFMIATGPEPDPASSMIGTGPEPDRTSSPSGAGPKYDILTDRNVDVPLFEFLETLAEDLTPMEFPKPIEAMEDVLGPSVIGDGTNCFLPWFVEESKINLCFLKPLDLLNGGGTESLISTSGEKFESQGKPKDPSGKDNISSTTIPSQVEMDIDGENDIICLGEFPARGESKAPQPEANQGGNVMSLGPDPATSTGGTGPESDPAPSASGTGPKSDLLAHRNVPFLELLETMMDDLNSFEFPEGDSESPLFTVSARRDDGILHWRDLRYEPLQPERRQPVLPYQTVDLNDAESNDVDLNYCGFSL